MSASSNIGGPPERPARNFGRHGPPPRALPRLPHTFKTKKLADKIRIYSELFAGGIPGLPPEKKKSSQPLQQVSRENIPPANQQQLSSSAADEEHAKKTAALTREKLAGVGCLNPTIPIDKYEVEAAKLLGFLPRAIGDSVLKGGKDTTISGTEIAKKLEKLKPYWFNIKRSETRKEFEVLIKWFDGKKFSEDKILGAARNDNEVGPIIKRLCPSSLLVVGEDQYLEAFHTIFSQALNKIMNNIDEEGLFRTQAGENERESVIQAAYAHDLDAFGDYDNVHLWCTALKTLCLEFDVLDRHDMISKENREFFLGWFELLNDVLTKIEDSKENNQMGWRNLVTSFPAIFKILQDNDLDMHSEAAKLYANSDAKKIFDGISSENLMKIFGGQPN